MSVASGQQRTFLQLLGRLRPHWRSDRNLPTRIQMLLSRNRSFGSRDRRLYRELIYITLRYLPWIEPWLDREPDRAVRIATWLSAETGATQAFRAELPSDWPPRPEILGEQAAFLGASPAELLPRWFYAHCPAIFEGEELAAQLRRAPLWLRLQTDQPEVVLNEFSDRGWHWRRSPMLDSAVQLLGEVDATKTEAYRRGFCEVQDLGSQLILESIGIEPGGCWLDACAGSGGKALQLARLLGRGGNVDACDIRATALRELATRSSRARLTNIVVLKDPPSAAYAGVLVDAPCSGSGTWRRAPHLKWTTTGRDVKLAATKQRELLDKFCRRVQPGGRLIYATCSLSRWENEDVVAAFLGTHPEFSPSPLVRTFGAVPRGDGLTFLPGRHDGDGFFLSSLRRA